MKYLGEIVFIVFLLIAFTFFMFPLIISIWLGNYWLFFLFAVSWIPALIIVKLGAEFYRT